MFSCCRANAKAGKKDKASKDKEEGAEPDKEQGEPQLNGKPEKEPLKETQKEPEPLQEAEKPTEADNPVKEEEAQPKTDTTGIDTSLSIYTLLLSSLSLQPLRQLNSSTTAGRRALGFRVLSGSGTSPGSLHTYCSSDQELYSISCLFILNLCASRGLLVPG